MTVAGSAVALGCWRRVVQLLLRRRIELASLLVATVPLLLSSPGKVGADTKSYLYLDPGRLLGDASSLWDSDVALGTVTHQNIGYLWPMGPYYWLMETLGSPDWVSQRLWLAAVIFAAGMGVRFLLRTLQWEGAGLFVAMLAYQLSPYLLDYSARISALLLPWAALPWMIGLTITSVRDGGWRSPSRFALVVLTIGSVNASSLLFVGLGPALWLVHVTVVERSVSWARAIAAAARIVFLTVMVSLWWIAGLVLQGRYSLPVTRYTETYQVVADAATAPEILRGLGYWFFYGKDKFGSWIQPSIYLTQSMALLFLTFGLVVLALVGATLVRWRHRSFFLLLLVVGALIGIGSHPFDSPSLAGRWFETFTRTDAGLALRSTPRAVPLVVLATAVLLGCLVNAVHRQWPRPGRVLMVLTALAVVLANPAMWAARMIEPNLQRDESLPDYWRDAIADLDSNDDGTRIWEVPGTDFSSYRWGNTVDPITPGLTDRGYVARELVPFGSAESANLLVAFDRRLQEWTLPAAALVPIARLMSVGALVHRGDLTYERFRTPRPALMEQWLSAIEELGTPTTYGVRGINQAGPEQVLRDEVALSIADEASWPISVYSIPEPLDVVRLRPVDTATVVVGDGAGLVDAASAGLLDVSRPLFFAADLVTDRSLFEQVADHVDVVLITDSNRKRAQRWGGLRETVGYTELAGQEPLVFDPQDNRLPVFPAAESTLGLDPDDVRTVAVHQGDGAVTASRYGNRVTYTIDDRPVLAVDGDLETAWSVGAFSEARDEFLRFTFDTARTVETLTVVQPQEEANRRITDIALVSDRGERREFTLGPDSLTPAGQTLRFAALTGTVFDLIIEDLDTPKWDDYPVGVSPVGFAEVRLGNAEPLTEWIRTPRAFIDRTVLAKETAVVVVLTRERVNPQEPVRSTSELQMRRIVPLNRDATFTVNGVLRLDTTQESAAIDRFLGRGQGGLSASSSGSLPGNLQTVPSAALDHDPTTAFTGLFGAQIGQFWEVTIDEPSSIDGIDIDVVVDGQHSVPSRLTIEVDGEPYGSFAIDPSLAPSGETPVVSVHLPVQAADASVLRVTVAESQDVVTQDWYSSAFVPMPWSMTEVRVGGWPTQPLADAERVSLTCVGGLVSVDGHDVPVRIEGDSAEARRGAGVPFESCDPVTVRAGDVPVVTARSTAEAPITVDQLVLDTGQRPAAASVLPRLEPVWTSATRAELQVPEDRGEAWLVLGQSYNRGWTARLNGDDLGPPVVVDGFANGWRLPSGGGDVVLEWTPQGMVDRAVMASGVTAFAVIWLAFRRRRRGVDVPLRGPELLGWPGPGSHRPGRWVMVLGVALVTGFCLLNLPELLVLAPVIGGLWWLACRGGWRGRLLPAVAAVIYGICSLLIMGEQFFADHPPDFVWPRHFDDVHILGVATVLLLAGEYLRGAFLGARNGLD